MKENVGLFLEQWLVIKFVFIIFLYEYFEGFWKLNQVEEVFKIVLYGRFCESFYILVC